MTLHSVRLVVEKRRGEEPPSLAGEFTWRKPDLPSRMLFVGMLEEIYEDIELPYFPHRVEAEAELDDRIVPVEILDAVAPPEEVGLALWAAMARAASGL